MLKHYVQFSSTGAFLIEYSVREIARRDPRYVEVPAGAYAFQFFDREEVVVYGKRIVGEKTNYSPITYLGREYTLNQVKAQFPENKILIGNMECNRWDRAVKTRSGIWQPLEKGDIVRQCF